MRCLRLVGGGRGLLGSLSVMPMPVSVRTTTSSFSALQLGRNAPNSAPLSSFPRWMAAGSGGVYEERRRTALKALGKVQAALSKKNPTQAEVAVIAQRAQEFRSVLDGLAAQSQSARDKSDAQARQDKAKAAAEAAKKEQADRDRALAEAAKKEAAEAEARRLHTNRRFEYVFALPQSGDPAHVKKSLKGRQSGSVACVATNGDCTLIVYTNGVAASTAGLPDGLWETLTECNKPGGRNPVFAALGTHNRYYVRFSDGSSQWVGPECMTKLLKKDKRQVIAVSFGESFEHYFVLFESGGWQSVGAPEGLLKEINGSTESPEYVSIGPDGEWFVRFPGSAWAGGMSDKANSAWGRAKTVSSVIFGIHDSFFMQGTW